MCNPLNTVDDGMSFLYWAQWAFVGPAEFNYYFPNGLYGVAYPLQVSSHLLSLVHLSLSSSYLSSSPLAFIYFIHIQKMCEILMNSTYNSSLDAVVAAVSFSWNFTGVYTNPPCFPTTNMYYPSPLSPSSSLSISSYSPG